MKPDWKLKEEKIRKYLGRKIALLPDEESMTLRNSSKTHKFDIVSRDRETLVGEVKSYKFDNETTGKAGYTTTRKARLLEACFYLERVQAKRRVLILTDKRLYEQFTDDTHGLLDKSIEVIHIPV